MIGVHLLQVPDEGQHLEGDEDAGFLDLAAIGAKPAGVVHYALEVGVSGTGVFATGRVAVPVEMTCVAVRLRGGGRTFRGAGGDRGAGVGRPDPGGQGGAFIGFAKPSPV